ncbi:non-ribosomal peptide synthetase [Kibdelosporangium aridum]|uniref:Phenyloxazoline synthase MbtB n=1 Tax=Kibdelosporangium aridum TaxID=2030 RepID=A0A1Y5X9G0_KIBAR|nr:non-ribosomal peptide synthetase [Kibdelosporangium aridum]SMC73849.1 Phosphopantetheine attachment site [Kibdelosporangium aridum]
MSVTHQDLRTAVADVLGLDPGDLEDTDDLVALGLDSLHAMTLAGMWRRAGTPVKFAELIERPTLADWWALLSERDSSPTQDQVEVDESEPFELALMQHAYWVGRAEGQQLGGVAAHFYHEFDGVHVDPDRLEAAVRALFARHGMLRVRILDDGRQQILAESPWPGLKVHTEPDLAELRRELSHRAMDIAAGEVFDVQLSLLPDGRTRIHVNLDMVAADALSLRVLMRDLARLYRGETLSPLEFSYPRYLGQRKAVKTDERAKQYWQDRLADLPGAPQLPAAMSTENTVVRRHRWLDPQAMRGWEQRARRAGLTPAMALAAVFAETLTAWSAEPEFLLNLPLFDREPLWPDVAGLVGDFTSSVLLAWDGRTPGSFAERASRLQDRFHADAVHSSYSGVDVLRDASRMAGEQVIAPVVYTSALGLGELFDAEVKECFGEPSWIISQGPQVWLDAQVTELNGGLLVNWDAREDAFAPGVLDAMFAAYSDLLDRLLTSDEAWSQPVTWVTGQRPQGPAAEVTSDRLHDRFFARATAEPNRTALAWGENNTRTYGELATRALAIAGALQARGVQPGDLVAVSLPKGPEQIEAVLGVLAAGAAYLPLGVDHPAARRERILATAGVKLVLDEPITAAPLDAPVAGAATDLAYVIYTSGSTGEPKGVEVSHAAAMNTIDDLIARFEITDADRTIALSALDFDLSVFDVFAPLSAGGAVVLIDEASRRDAHVWADLVRRHHVTVVNCVPALLDMLLTADGDLPLRVAIVGGDWVGTDLPKRTTARFAGLGGTTETAIHSTVCEVEDVPEGWTSVPYGTPLTNVRCRVVDALGRDCPDWVPGELWIGGASVANGYRGDPARTAEKFLTVDGIRWYRTGDQARYWPDGTIEFLGRKDFQVKVRGQRIELGEIEASLTACPGVGRAVAVVADGRIAAAVTPPVTPVQVTPSDGIAESEDGPLIAAYLTHLLGLAPSVISRFDAVAKLWRDWLHGRTPQAWREARHSTSGAWLSGIADALDARTSDLLNILKGNADPLSLLDDPVLAPEALLHALPDSASAITALAQAVADQAKVLGRPVRLAELGARSGLTAERLLAHLPADVVQYTLLDPSASHLADAADRLPGVTVRKFTGDTVDDDLRHRFDVVLSFCSLHTYPDPATGPALAALLLAPGATLWVVEQPVLLPLALISAALLEEGFRNGSPMLDTTQWTKLVAAAGLTEIESSVNGTLSHIRATRSSETIGDLTAFVAERLPTAMVPDRIAVLPKMPLTSNGKIDRPALTRMLSGQRAVATTPPATEIERRVAEVWGHVLGLSEIGRENDFFELGGDSLLATRTIGRLRAAGLNGVTLSGLFASPTVADFAKTLTWTDTVTDHRVVADVANRHEPFPATDVQRAYWIGRGSGLALGGVGTHFYSEFDGQNVDLHRLELAFGKLIERHEMLRAVFDEEGRQRILPAVPRFTIPVLDGDVDDLRDAMSHQVLNPEQWPLFDVRAVRYGDRTRIGISLDNIVLDGLSMMVVYSELDKLYNDPDVGLPPIDVSFRDYVLQVSPEPAALERAQNYWRERVPQLPPAPQLPLRIDPSTVDTPRFVRREAFLDTAKWELLKERAKNHGLTPSTVLLACYAEVLSMWSGGHAVTVNLTLFDRREVHPHINRVLGDFTSLLLAAYQPNSTWLSSARALQEQTWRDLDHRDVSAMWVMRELAKAQGAAQVGMPVVFTGALGVDDEASFDVSGAFGERVWGISQTPQVWLDLQVHETKGGLSYALDAVEELFFDGVVGEMFDALGVMLDWLTREDWDTAVPRRTYPVREKVNATGEPRGGLLHAGFFTQAEQEPGRVALIWDGGESTYGEVADRALRVAAKLRKAGVEPGELVAVSMPKGPDQITAVLGVLAAGAAYVPIGVDQPAARRDKISQDAGVRLVLQDIDDLGERLDGPLSSELAYVIYTSGSTGQPKGVEMTHAAAMNTVDDINTRYGVGPDDRVLAVSALDFDLSVYDIFGLLSVGGALVLIREDERRDPQAWLRYANEHAVTVWNTVPTLLDMLLVTGQHRSWPASLRLALVSGDWVGLDLPGRLRQTGDCHLVALGGATEAAIWSNAFDVTEVPAHWVSVPYGFPLRAQRYRVVDGQGRDCPDWVPGELWIGGAGVADGYRRDPARTAEKFVIREGARWYRTGDRGRYWPDGTLEFLGRVDHQVKVRGHRIELGEIEAALTSHPGVKDGYAIAVGEPSRRRLAAFVVPSGDIDGLTDHLRDHLPAYAVPGSVVVLDEVPLTANGKVDRAALAKLTAPETVDEQPVGETERMLVRLWLSILDEPVIGRHGHFFALGGDSLSATRLVERLRRDHGVELTLRQVFAAPTVAELAALVDDLNSMEEGTL